MSTERPEMSVAISLKDLVEKRLEQLQTIREVTHDKNYTEQQIMSRLLKEKMFDAFTINWRKLDAMVNNRGKYAER